MTTIRYAAGMLALLCWAVVLVTMTADAWIIIATALTVLWAWTFGVFTWAFWFADAATSERLAAVDEALDFEASVLGDLSHLNDEQNGR